MAGTENSFFEDFVRKFDEEIRQMGHANLIVSGKTGVGKSTLINAAFREDVARTGVGEPVTQEIRLYSKDRFPLRIYDTMGIELASDRQEQAVKQIRDLCEAKKRSGNGDEMIHAMWYCVHGNGARIEPYEIEFINRVSEEMPVVVVLTQCIIRSLAESLKTVIEKKNTRASGVIITRAQPYRDDEGRVLPAFGVRELVEYTYSLLPQAAQRAWINAQKASVRIKQEAAQALVLTTAAASFGEGYIPLPFSDSFAIAPTQIAMIAGITAIYGLKLSKSLLTGIVSSLLGTASTTLAGKTLAANLIKLLPGVGTALGGTISGATAALLTTALGEAYILVMNKVFTGEISREDLESGAVREDLSNLLKEKLRRNAPPEPDRDPPAAPPEDAPAREQRPGFLRRLLGKK